MPKSTFFNLPAEKRALVEQAAIDEFARRGFQAASITQIVAAAGIAKGSFYQYFEDKRDLFLHLVERAAQEKAAYFQSRPPPQGLDFFDSLRWLFEAGYAYAAEQSPLNQAVSRVLFGEGLYLGEMFAEVRAASARAFTGMIEQALANGRIDPGVDPSVAAFMVETLLNALGPFLLARQPDPSPGGSLEWLASPQARRDINQLISILEHGMKHREKNDEILRPQA